MRALGPDREAWRRAQAVASEGRGGISGLDCSRWGLLLGDVFGLSAETIRCGEQARHPDSDRAAGPGLFLAETCVIAW